MLKYCVYSQNGIIVDIVYLVYPIFYKWISELIFSTNQFNIRNVCIFKFKYNSSRQFFYTANPSVETSTIKYPSD